MLGKNRVMLNFNVWSRKVSAKMGVKLSMKLIEIEVNSICAFAYL
jgi:hypothetical protein